MNLHSVKKHSTQAIGVCRVSSEEQAREGFSLDYQETALLEWSKREGVSFGKLIRLVETASKHEERTIFHEVLALIRRSKGLYTHLVFYRVDRAIRSMESMVELERLENDFGVEIVFVNETSATGKSGRFVRRMMAVVATEETDRLKVRITTGIERRVKEGWFPGHPPYGYRTRRVDGRSVVEVVEREAAVVREIFKRYAYGQHTLSSLVKSLEADGFYYTAKCARLNKTKAHTILKDRSYIGDVFHRGQWVPGKQATFVDRATFDRVQTLLSGGIRRSHEHTFAGKLVRCQFCGGYYTGEEIFKYRGTPKERSYLYYRCSMHDENRAHDRKWRLPAAELDRQIIRQFEKLRVDDPDIKEWFKQVIQARAGDDREATKKMLTDMHRQAELLTSKKAELLEMRLAGEVDAETYAQKDADVRDRIARLRERIAAVDLSANENAEFAIEVFELAQTLKSTWENADYAAKRTILDVIGLNYRMTGITLEFDWRKPFDVLIEGFQMKNGGGAGN